jgi:ABC-type multidrug transport system fused ATPase/permease subunit
MSPARPWWDYRSFYLRADLKLATVAAISGCSALLWIPVPLLVRHLFDTTVPTGTTDDIVRIGLVLAALLVASELLALIRRRIAIRETRVAAATIRRAVIRRIHRMAIEEHKQTDPERLRDLIVQAPERIDAMAYALVAIVLPTIVLTIGTTVVMVSIAPILALEIAALVPLMYVVHRWTRPRVAVREERHAAAGTSFDAAVTFSLRSLELTRTLGLDAEDVERLDRKNRALSGADRATGMLQGYYRTLTRIVFAVVAVVVLVTGSIFATRNELSVGDLFAFYAALAILSPPIMLTLRAFPEIRQGRTALGEVTNMLGTGTVEPYGGTRAISDPTPLEFSGVGFSYDDDPLLEDVTFSLHAGEVTMISGPNGSGKTTLISLILGLYHPARGRVGAGGRPYDELDITSLRRTIGVVPQHAEIITGTIGDNIKYGKPGAGDVEMWQAAHLATVDDFIVDFAAGYDHPLAFEGRTLSGGQRQRVAIARALIRTPRILILDEPGSHLDGGTLRRIITNLDKLPIKPAVLITSHHPRFIDHVDHLYLLEGRRLVPSTLMTGAADTEPD